MTAIEVPLTLSAMSKLLAGKRVLVVDDEPDALELVEDFLQRAGAIASLARSAEEALRKLDERPDIIISDISMPDGDGYQLIRRIRARSADRGGTTPAIALTAHVADTDHSRALLAGFQMHLSKPIKAMELVASIHQLLARRSVTH
jgi:CheY-like chemotaxis protein